MYPIVFRVLPNQPTWVLSPVAAEGEEALEEDILPFCCCWLCCFCCWCFWYFFTFLPLPESCCSSSLLLLLLWFMMNPLVSAGLSGAGGDLRLLPEDEEDDEADEVEAEDVHGWSASGHSAAAASARALFWSSASSSASSAAYTVSNRSSRGKRSWICGRQTK